LASYDRQKKLILLPRLHAVIYTALTEKNFKNGAFKSRVTKQMSTLHMINMVYNSPAITKTEKYTFGCLDTLIWEWQVELGIIQGTVDRPTEYLKGAYYVYDMEQIF
jgi:hypothetical protein